MNRYAVPLELLLEVHVPCAEQVEVQAEPRLLEPLVAAPPYADGAGGDADGD